MKPSSVRLALLLAALSGRAWAADDPEPKTNMSEVLRAHLAEEAKKKPVAPAPKAAATTKSAPAAAAAPTLPEEQKGPKDPDAAANTAKTKKETPTVLPKVEVNQRRITELDRQMQKQEQDIAREQAKAKPTEMDKALNDSKVAKALSIFGGESNTYRANVAKERVSLMEEEKDLIEAIAHAKTKEEKEELRKQLDELKAMRRQLEKSLK